MKCKHCYREAIPNSLLCRVCRFIVEPQAYTVIVTPTRTIWRKSRATVYDPRSKQKA
jgi:hypothetical protein